MRSRSIGGWPYRSASSRLTYSAREPQDKENPTTAALGTASHQRLKSLERFAGRGQALHFRRKLPASGLGARSAQLRLFEPPVQIGQLRLRFLQQPSLVFEPAQPGNLLEHLIALGGQRFRLGHRFLGDPPPLLGLSLERGPGPALLLQLGLAPPERGAHFLQLPG